MMKKIISCLCLVLIATLSFSQIKVFETSRGKRISKHEFDQLLKKSDFFYAYKYLADTVVTFGYDGDRDFKGKLSQEDMMNFRQIYPSLEGNQPVIIQYFPGIDNCNSHYKTNEMVMIEFLKSKDKKISNGKRKLYNVYKSNEGIENLCVKMNWQKDEGQFIEKLFFPYHFPCESYVVVGEDGNYRGYYGEYMVSQVLKDYKKLK